MKNTKKFLAVLLSAVLALSFVPVRAAEGEENTLILRYSFDEKERESEDGSLFVPDVSGRGNDGLISGSVGIRNGYGSFDGNGSFITMPNSIVAGEENVTFVINVRPDMGRANQFTFTIGNSSASGYLFLNTNRPDGTCRFAITDTTFGAERDVSSEGIEEGQWCSIAVVMEGKILKMYCGGELKAEKETDLLASSLGDTAQNYIAKSQYEGDPYFKGYIDDFRIYAAALSEEEILSIAQEHAAKAEEEEALIRQEKLEAAADTLSFEETALSSNVELPTEIYGAFISWSSDKPQVLSAEGVVTRQTEDEEVTLTASFSDEYGNVTERSYVFTVLRKLTDEECVAYDAENFVLVGNLLHLKEDLYLPLLGEAGSAIEWSSSDESVITNTGVITQAEIGGGKREAVLTATISSGEVSRVLEFPIAVEETDYAYLFAYFTGNSPSQEQLYYGLSLDGYYFNALNGGNSVLKENVGTGCLRDPYIFRGQDGLYYCLVTDMQSSLGWDSNHAMTVWSSEDLIVWENETRFDFRELFGETIYGFDAIDRVWAPQAIWDPEYECEDGEKGAYMIYLALKIPALSPQTQMYKVYTKDFKTLISAPELLYCHDVNGSDIDADIIYRDGLYYMYVKDETQGGVYVTVSEHAGGPYGERIAALPRQNTNGGNVAIEGSGIFRRIGEDKYSIVYDAYNSGFFIMTETEDLVTFNQLSRSKYGFDFTPRHGYVVTVSKSECEALMEVYGTVIPEEPEKAEEPVIYYDFEEDGSDKSGNFNDASFAQGAAVAEGAGVKGNSLCLNGSSDSYVTVPSEAVSCLYDYTISAWIKPEERTTTQRVFDFGTGTGRYMFFTPYYTSNECRYAMTVSSYQNETSVSSDVYIPTGKWTHIAVASEKNTITLYINGRKAGQAEEAELDPYEISSLMTQCYIGRSQWPADAYYKGYIDEFAVYSRALSEEEIRYMYFGDTPFKYSVSEENGVVTLELISDGTSVPRAVAVIAEYNEDEILINLALKEVSFEKESRAEVSLAVQSGNYQVMILESVGSMKPIR